jgi:hypothetical protein
VNGLSTFVTTTDAVVRTGGSASTDGAGTGTYTVAQTGRVYFIVQGGGGGGGEWYGRGPGGGGGGGAYGYFNSLTAGVSVSVAYGGSGSGNGADPAGGGSGSTLSIGGTTLVTGAGGGAKYNGNGGGGGAATVVTNNGTYPITSTTARNGTSGGGDVLNGGTGNGGQGWFTQDGEDDYNWRTNTVNANPGQKWISGTNHGWGDGGGGGYSQNKGGNSGTPGIVFLWQNSYTVTNAGDPYYPAVKAFGGSGVTTNAQGTPSAGISLSDFSGQYTRAELS